VLGPLLRYADATSATVWLETGAACEVEVLGRRTTTFQVEGHHYALVVLEGLAPGSVQPYRVRLDGEPVWPPAGGRLPPSVLRTPRPGGPLRVVFGSCRATGRAAAPALDALDALAATIAAARRDPTGAESLPDLLLLLGDQVYADDVPETVGALLRARPASPGGPPAGEVADFDEYAALYQAAWGGAETLVPWLLSTVPVAMIFDDHEIHDDWNTSAAWVAAARARPWWHERLVSGLMAYWVYQHLGNLSPAELAADPLAGRILGGSPGRPVDAGPLLRQHAERAAATEPGVADGPGRPRWSYARDLGRTRLVVIDSRCGRVLPADPGRRAMLDDHEWRWLERQVGGDVDHLLLATSLPYLLPHGVHELEAWNEAVCAGAWGAAAAAAGERARQRFDLEHWAAFGDSFDRLAALLTAVAAGRHGPPPASILLLSGDVHHAYLARAGFPPAAGARSATWQLVCSPFRLRRPLDALPRLAVRLAATRPAAWALRLLARAAGVTAPALGWRVLDRPRFDHNLGLLELDGRGATVRVQRPGAAAGGQRLEPLFERRLSHGP
jgi:PhoD-like phosphatase